jgi:hypothetical protein
MGLATLALITQCLMAQSIPATNPNANPLQIGLYVTDIRHLDFDQNQFDASFWIYVHHLHANQPIADLQILHASHVQKTLLSRHTYPDGSFTDVAKITATIHQPMNLRHYPFDQQHLVLAVEDAHHQNKQTVLSPFHQTAQTNQMLDDQATPANWQFKGLKQAILSHHYSTSFGNQQQPNHSVFSQYRLTLDFQRIGFRQFMIHMTLLFLAMLLAIVTQFIASTTQTTQQRNSLLLAAVFCMTSAYVIGADIVKHSAQLLLVDKLQILTLFVVLMSFLIDQNIHRIPDSIKRKLGYGMVSFATICAAVLLLQI